MKNKNYQYHLQMLITELANKQFNTGDTRENLSIDRTEWNILMSLLCKELLKETNYN